MGMAFGKICVETPNYELIKSTPNYEIRKYPTSVVAEITYDPTQFKGDKDGGFTILANYIGDPKNSPSEKIAMTAPVVTTTAHSSPEKIAMTAPVVTKKDRGEERVTMGFILPSKYKAADEAPRPVDERVVVVVRAQSTFVRFHVSLSRSLPLNWG